MKVLMVSRPDARQVPGGDTVQMRELARALRGLGLMVEERLGAQKGEDYAGWTLVHLFNLQTPDFTLGEARKIRAAGRPLVLSPIYWDFSRYRQELALLEWPKWRVMRRAMGTRAAGWLWRFRHHRPMADAQRQAVMLSDVLLPNSRGEQEQVDRLGAGPKPFTVVHCGLDPARFDPSLPRLLPEWARTRGIASKSYVLSAGRVEPIKNGLGLLRALRGTGIPVVLAGDTTDSLYAKDCEAQGAILTGRLEEGELEATFAHARVHAQPSFTETLGMASMEAAAMGCAVVSTTTGGLREYLGDQARYCDPGDAESIRRALLAAWKAGPPGGLAQQVRTRFTWKAAAQETVEGYRMVLAEEARKKGK